MRGGAITGAVIFFAVEDLFGATGVGYLIGLGAVALVMPLARDATRPFWDDQSTDKSELVANQLLGSPLQPRFRGRFSTLTENTP
jgi:hypothetical protein